MHNGGGMLFVRPVAASDWRSYRDLRLRALRDSHEVFASTHERESVRDDDDWLARVSAVASSSTAQAFFAHWNNEACGLVWCKASDVESSVVEIFQMWVAPDARGLGAGSALLESAITWAEDRGAACVRLGVTIADSPAMHLYKASGFHAVGAPEPLREGSALMSQSMELNLGSRLARKGQGLGR
ncbi:GNAT family N-acetyltransferase [Pseudomonas putida]|nr:GNAT family N-acetyltransferase [Pseudomonas putida]